MASSSGGLSRAEKASFFNSMNQSQQKELIGGMGDVAWGSMLGRRLETYATHNDQDMVKKFVAAGAKLDGALHWAIRAGRVQVVKILLEGGADPTVKCSEGNTALHTAVAAGRLRIVRLLLSNLDVYVDTRDQYRRTALYVCVTSDKYCHGGVVDPSGHGIVEALLEAGADPNARCGNRGETPVHVAYKNVVMISKLIDHGGSVDAEDDHGERPLHHAVRNSPLSIPVLCTHGASVDATMDGGVTPLHLASTGFPLPITTALIKAGADVDARTDAGNTPLHVVAQSAETGIIAYSPMLNIITALLLAGADEKLLDADGRSPVDIVGARIVNEENIGDEREIFERARTKLLAAPADRAWRNRGLLVMIRVTMEREAEQRQEEAPKRLAQYKIGSRERRARGGWVGAVEWLLSETSGVPEEIFRNVVSFL